jgi:hypothetical protein
VKAWPKESEKVEIIEVIKEPELEKPPEPIILDEEEPVVTKLVVDSISDKNIQYLEDEQEKKYLELHDVRSLDKGWNFKIPNDFPPVYFLQPFKIWESAKNYLIANRYEKELQTRGEDNDPFAYYHFNYIQQYEGTEKNSVKGAFLHILEENRKIKGLSGINIKHAYSFLLEHCQNEPSLGFEEVNGEYVKYELPRFDFNNIGNLPKSLYFGQQQERIDKYLDYLNANIGEMLDKVECSGRKRFVAITGVSFKVFRIRDTGGKIVGLEEFIKNQQIYACSTDNNTCVLEAILFAQSEV